MVNPYLPLAKGPAAIDLVARLLAVCRLRFNTFDPHLEPGEWPLANQPASMLEWPGRCRYTHKGRMIHSVERFVPVAQVADLAIEDL